MAYTDIDDPSAYFQTLLYTGNGADDRALVNDGNSDLQPDWIWFKERNSTSVHQVLDSSRGVNKALSPNDNGADETYAYLSSFDSNGFTFDLSDGSTNENTNTFVAWQWKANGGTTTTNDASATGIGNTDSVYQANTTAGFSIVTFSGTGSGMTVAHGLGGTPTLIISKSRNDTENWAVHTTVIDGSLDYLRLSETDAAGNSGFSLPTSTVFGYNGSNNYVAYCFRSIQGYSKIGRYVGNGSTDGTFAYTGFKPAWVLVKSVDVAQSWQLSDSARNPFNVVNRRLAPNDTSAESTVHSWIDFLSNGFKIRINDAAYNNNGQKYLYIAFAENPFCSSKGVPTTAR
mgnify:CR=1 FL=1